MKINVTTPEHASTFNAITTDGRCPCCGGSGRAANTAAALAA